MKEEVITELERLAKENGGRLTPEMVVDTAKDPDNPLHDAFEWDDSVAARAFRIQQARGLIRSVRIVIKTDKKTVRTVAYVRDPQVPSDEQGYVSTAVVRTDADLAREVIVTEFSRVASALSRARELAAVLEMQDEVDQLINGVAELRAQVEPANA